MAPPAGLVLKHLTCLSWADVLSPEGARQATKAGNQHFGPRAARRSNENPHLWLMYLFSCAQHFE